MLGHTNSVTGINSLVCHEAHVTFLFSTIVLFSYIFLFLYIFVPHESEKGALVVPRHFQTQGKVQMIHSEITNRPSYHGEKVIVKHLHLMTKQKLEL